MSFIIVYHNEARSALLRTICMGYIDYKCILPFKATGTSLTSEISILVSILKTVPARIVGEIILIDDASDDKNMLLELDRINVS